MTNEMKIRIGKYILIGVKTIGVYFLWNWLMPDLFGLREINIPESWGLILLSGFLFRKPTDGQFKKLEESILKL